MPSQTPTLFETLAQNARPLADRLRPQTLQEIIGQQHLLGAGKPLTRWLESKKLPSLILWGPPGCGKTTLARLLAQQLGFEFETLSPLTAGVPELRKVFERAYHHKSIGKQCLLFVDEIHRFNRAQQDVFLAPIEEGTLLLVGATTENPSFELNPALLSRCQVLTLHRLTLEELAHLLARAEEREHKKLPLTPEARDTLCRMADGDGRALLNRAEILFSYPAEPLLAPEQLSDAIQKRAPLYDKGQEEHYNLISALHKAVRGSDPDAALYWLCRMLEGGEDPLFLARRLVRMAVEDIGLAEPAALTHAIAARDAYLFLGSPEGELALANSVVYLATAPKSNAAYVAYKKARHAAKASGSLPPPKHILNAPTVLMKKLGYGSGYIYDPDTEEGFSGQNYFPEEMQRPSFYTPKGEGKEKEILDRLEEWTRLREKK
jgi:putative ATPase